MNIFEQLRLIENFSNTRGISMIYLRAEFVISCFTFISIVYESGRVKLEQSDVILKIFLIETSKIFEITNINKLPSRKKNYIYSE